MTSAAHVGFVRVVVDPDHIIKVAPIETIRSHGPSDTCSLPEELQRSNLSPSNYSLSLIWGEITTPLAPTLTSENRERRSKFAKKNREDIIESWRIFHYEDIRQILLRLIKGEYNWRDIYYAWYLGQMHTKFKKEKKKLTGIQHFETLDMDNRIILKLILTLCSQKFVEIIELYWDRGSTVVKVLCYKSEGRWFDPRWCHWNVSLT